MMMPEKLPVVRYAESLPSNLLNAEELSEFFSSMNVILSPQRLIELADAYVIPHYRVDNGPPVFQTSECRKWVGNNLTQRVDGSPTPITYRVIGRPGIPLKDCPSCLSQISDRLLDVSSLRLSGVYFLCVEGEVVYVGQAVNVATRIAAHLVAKEFDRAYDQG